MEIIDYLPKPISYTDKTEFITLDDEFYLNHQTFIQRFMSPQTIHRSLFLYFEMGTGKSLTAVSVAEACLKRDIKRVVILATSPNVIESFKKQVLLRFQSTKEVFVFQTIYLFCKDLLVRFRTDEERRAQFNYTLFIVDEAHHVHPTDTVTFEEESKGTKLSSKNYWLIHSLFHQVPTSKVLLLSGTPMTNSPKDIIPLLNLILPISRQLTEPDLKDHIQLTEKIQNHVAYYRRPDDSNVKRIITRITLPLIGIQKRHYISINNDTTNLYKNSLQSGLCVYPDGTFGSIGKKYPNISMDKLAECSNKYNYIIKHTKRHPTDTYLVYIDVLTGGGIKLFSHLLVSFGLKHVVLTGSTPKKEATATIQKINSGELKVRLVVISRAFAEGITLSTINNVVIVTPHWNQEFMNQIIYRARPSITSTEIFTVKVHELVGNDLDTYIYKTSSNKESSIRPIVKLLTKSAVNCFLTYNNCHTKPTRSKPDEAGFIQIDLIGGISKYFQSFLYGSLDDIVEFIQQERHATHIQVEYCLLHHIKQHTPIKTRYGSFAYLQYTNPIFTLATKPDDATPITLFNVHTIPTQIKTVALLDEVTPNVIADTRMILRDIETADLTQLTRLQEYACIEYILKAFPTNQRLMNWVVSKGTVKYGSLYYGNKSWKIPVQFRKNVSPVPVRVEPDEEKTEQPHLSFSGKLDNGVFKIYQVGKRGTGRSCATLDKKMLTSYITQAGGSIPEGANKKELCKILFSLLGFNCSHF